MNKREVVIVDALRTPIGRLGGALKDVRPDDLAAHVIRKLVERTGISGSDVDEVVFGCANQAGEDNRNVARMATLLAGLPVEVSAYTVNRLCASGLDAVNGAARLIALGEADVIIAGGVESMTRAPWVMQKPDASFPRGNQTMYDTTLGWRMTNPQLAAMHHPFSMGETAENVAERYQISREEQDAFALESQKKTGRAMAEGRFLQEIVPVEIPGRKGQVLVVEQDEHPRPDTTMESLVKLQAVFRAGGSVTAGNASGMNDGAAAVLLMSAEKALAWGLTPIAKVVGSASAGVDPAVMGLGPIPAVKKLLGRLGMSVDEIDVFELNEAFAVQVLACAKELGIDLAKVNPNGGAIALGHPLGCSGARLITTLAHEMRLKGHRYGLATMCVGVGQGVATVLERY